MGWMHYTRLSSRGLLRIGGEDARAFLQGLVTVDVATVSPRRTRYGAMLTPQGKFLHDFFLAAGEGALLLDTEAGRAEELQSRLLRYRLRSRVDVAIVEAMAVYAAWGEDALARSGLDAAGHTVSIGQGIAFADPRLAGLGVRVIAAPGEAEYWLQAHGAGEREERDYQAHRLRLGVPEGGSDLIVERSLLRHFGIDLLGGVDYAKGCYVGQEVTARSKHRGDLAKCVYRVQAESGSLPPPGTAIERNGQPVGEMRSSLEGTGLALLRVDAVEAQAGPLMTVEHPVRVWLPEWARAAE